MFVLYQGPADMKAKQGEKGLPQTAGCLEVSGKRDQI